MKQKTPQTILLTLLAWAVAIMLFFPVFWIIITSFKTELEAISSPPKFLFFNWTLENFIEVQRRSNYFQYVTNSIYLALGSTFIGLLLAVPAAWAMAFHPTKRTPSLLLWILSTKMMPAVGVFIPIYLIFRDWKLLDNIFGLIFVILMVNLPILIWMLYNYFKEIPKDILESARMDEASLFQEIVYILLPIAIPGIASTVLLNIILAWNEAFWSLNLTASDAAPLTVFIASYSSPEGLFWAKLSAASLLALIPILILGWFSQKQLVQGLTFGAVK
jgi:sorbitol/mannitol transport system permease protein